MRSLIVGATLALLLIHSSTVFAQQGFKFSSDYVVLADAKTLPRDIPTLYKIKKSVLGNLQGENVMEKLPYIKLAFDAQHLIYIDALNHVNDERAEEADRAFKKEFLLIENDVLEIGKVLLQVWGMIEKKKNVDPSAHALERFFVRHRLYTLFNLAKEPSEKRDGEKDDPRVPSLMDVANSEIEIFDAIAAGKLKYEQNPVVRDWIKLIRNGQETRHYVLFGKNEQSHTKKLDDLKDALRDSDFTLTAGFKIPNDTSEKKRNEFLDTLKQTVEMQWAALLGDEKEVKAISDRREARDFVANGEFLLLELVAYNHWKQAIPLMEKIVVVDELLNPDDPVRAKQRTEWKSFAIISKFIMADEDTDKTAVILASAALNRVYKNGIRE